MVDWCLFDFLLEYRAFSIFFLFFRLCQENYEFVLGWGAGKCGAFLSSLDRDPHPTCARCRGKICTHDMTCDFCIDWSPAQWELFAKKRSYKERKKSRPSGSVPPAPGASPPRGNFFRSSTARDFLLFFFLPFRGGRMRGGGLGVHLVLRPVRGFLPSRSTSV